MGDPAYSAAYAVLRLLTACLIGYLLGSSNMAYYIGKYKDVNLREGGSGNLGTCNAVLMLGKRAALLTAAHDMLKTVFSVCLVSYLFPGRTALQYVAGTASVLGHIFPFYLRFRGGKGFAAFLGLILAMDWKFYCLMLVATAVITVLSDHIVYGTFFVVLAYPLYLTLSGRPAEALIVLVATAFVIQSHRENILRLQCGEEIGLRQALNGEVS